MVISWHTLIPPGLEHIWHRAWNDRGSWAWNEWGCLTLWNHQEAIRVRFFTSLPLIVRLKEVANASIYSGKNKGKPSKGREEDGHGPSFYRPTTQTSGWCQLGSGGTLPSLSWPGKLQILSGLYIIIGKSPQNCFQLFHKKWIETKIEQRQKEAMWMLNWMDWTLIWSVVKNEVFFVCPKRSGSGWKCTYCADGGKKEIRWLPLTQTIMYHLVMYPLQIKR